MHDNRLLVVNAWPTAVSEPLVAPRAAGSSLTPHCHDNLVREMKEETGLDVTVGPTGPRQTNSTTPPGAFTQVTY